MTMGVTVKVTELTISTNGVGKPDKNPQFIENRVYQGSSGRVYPYVVIETISDECKDQDYKSVILKSQYLEVTVPPEPGGRIQYARDKTDDYDFVYRNRVIKPALVGLTGLWISSGIEFNWPQHHRPSTFLSVDCTFKGLPDGGKAVVCHDAVGLYVELMTRVFSENQPGFTWLKPCKQVGLVRNVSADTALSLEVGPEQIFGAAGEHEGIEAQGLKAGQGRVTVYATRVQENARVQLVADDGSIPYQWQGADRSEHFAANEELLLTGLRLEHYRYATYRPDPYYLERLKRDPGDACISNACGRLLLRLRRLRRRRAALGRPCGNGLLCSLPARPLDFRCGLCPHESGPLPLSDGPGTHWHRADQPGSGVPEAGAGTGCRPYSDRAVY